jgi:hypothetical protein
MRLLILAAVAALTLGATGAEAHRHHHYSDQGGRYVGGHGSSHRGGHYVNAMGGRHYRHHR